MNDNTGYNQTPSDTNNQPPFDTNNQQVNLGVRKIDLEIYRSLESHLEKPSKYNDILDARYPRKEYGVYIYGS